MEMLKVNTSRLLLLIIIAALPSDKIIYTQVDTSLISDNHSIIHQNRNIIYLSWDQV
jgi:hypothetical protein